MRYINLLTYLLTYLTQSPSVWLPTFNLLYLLHAIVFLQSSLIRCIHVTSSSARPLFYAIFGLMLRCNTLLFMIWRGNHRYQTLPTVLCPSWWVTLSICRAIRVTHVLCWFSWLSTCYRPPSMGGNTFGSVRPCVCVCVCPSVCLWALSCLNHLTFDLDFWQEGRPWPWLAWNWWLRS